MVDKAPGLLCQPGRKPEEPNLFALVRERLARRDGVPRPYLGLPHRLDRGTSGVVLLTKTRHVNPAIAELFARGRIEKLYLALIAVTTPLPGREWQIANRLQPQRSRGRRRQTEVEEGGQEAKSTFRLKSLFAGGASVEAQPHTGRFHQLRAHLAGSGTPIFGDRLYGYPDTVRLAAPRPMLHAQRLAFEHPVDGRRVVATAPLPPDFEAFRNQLRSAPESSRS